MGGQGTLARFWRRAWSARLARQPSAGPRRSHGEGGQGIVEFAMAFPLLFALMIGILEMGLVFHSYVTVVYAAREGARAGAVYLFQTDCPESFPTPGHSDFGLATNDVNRESGNTACGAAPNPPYYGDNVRSTIARALGPLDKPTAIVQVTYSPNPPVFANRYGDVINVSLTYPYTFLTPVLNNASITLRGQASHRIEP